MMACALAPLVLTVLLTGTSASLSPSGAQLNNVTGGTERAPSCPPGWLLFGQRCFAFYPVWSRWSTADFLCSQTGGTLASLHTPEERQFVRRLAATRTPVWLGGYQAHQNGSWVWSNGSPFTISGWTNQRQGKTSESGACLQMDSKSGDLHGAPCGELRFYICSTTARSEVFAENRKPVGSGLVPGVSLFDVVWGYSDLLAEEILHSSPFLQRLWAGQLTQRCHDSFVQQEALYLRGVGGTLEALLSGLREAGEARSLLLDTLKHYSSGSQGPRTSPPPQWLGSSLQSFHAVVLQEPIYWLVALSARACLRDFLARKQLFLELKPGASLVSGSRVKAGSLQSLRAWSDETLKEVAWTHRYRELLEDHRDQMDVFKAVNIFREHMMNQKSFFKAVACDVEEDDDDDRL